MCPHWVVDTRNGRTMMPAARRRSLQFGLGTMLVIVAAIGLAAAWLERTASVVRQREQVFEDVMQGYSDTGRGPVSWKIVSYIYGYKRGSIYWDGLAPSRERGYT